MKAKISQMQMLNVFLNTNFETDKIEGQELKKWAHGYNRRRALLDHIKKSDVKLFFKLSMHIVDRNRKKLKTKKQ